MRKVLIEIPEEIGFVGKNEATFKEALSEYLWNWFTVDTDDDESLNFSIIVD